MTIATETSAGQGLSEAEAARRLAEHGYNEIPERTQNAVLKFVSYLWNPSPG